MMNKPARQPLTSPVRRSRFALVAITFSFWIALIGLRLFWLQVVKHSEWVDRAERQQQRTFAVAPRRGVLYDRNLHELAMTVLVDSVYAVPSELGENRGEAAELLAKVVHTDPQDSFTTQQQMLARFNASKHFAWVARRLDAATADRVRQLNLKGVYFQKEFKRFYPDGNLAAQVLGYVGTDDTGLSGLEEEFDDEMHGAPGHKLTAVDAKSHVMGSVENEPMPGDNLVLTVDANIQHMAERALDEQVEKTKALHGTVVVQDPHTGQILALAVSPRFNPNDSRHIEPGSLKNLAVSDIYEPGSTFKLVTYSAALDAAGVQPTDLVDCQGGQMTMYGRTLHDDKSDHFGVVTVQQALEHSSDVGAAKMALKLGPQKFYEYIRSFGFGDRSGIELPSETRGILRPPKRWGSTSILSLAIGQEIGVTPVQLVSMVSAIANGGTYLPPHIVLQDTDEMKGDPRLKPAAFHPEMGLEAKLPDGSHRVIKPLTAAKMRAMMQGIVTEGTGKQAALNGYSSAGKTGTAEKIDPATHTYSHTKLVASFAGFAPVNNPAIAIAVVIDTPTAGGEAMHYGGAASAPVFSALAQEVLEYLGVPHDQPVKTQQQLAEARKPTIQEAMPESIADLNAMFSEVNNLPADDPLRKPEADPVAGTGDAGKVASSAAVAAPAAAVAAPASMIATGSGEHGSALTGLLPTRAIEEFAAKAGAELALTDTSASERPDSRRKDAVGQSQVGKGAVVVDAGRRVAVPDFAGEALRSVVERASALGIRVDPVGSGMARDQAPAAGTAVPVGTEVVVRFAR